MQERIESLNCIILKDSKKRVYYNECSSKAPCMHRFESKYCFGWEFVGNAGFTKICKRECVKGDAVGVWDMVKKYEEEEEEDED